MTYQRLTQQRLNKLLERTSPHSFQFNIARMHDIYRLPKNHAPTLDAKDLGEDAITRLEKFQRTLKDEVAEFDTAEDGKLSIKQKIEAYQAMTHSQYTAEEIEEARQDCLTDIADWFADVIVYCRSEAMKFGLPLEDVQDAVMGSNFTKLPSDGIPIYNADGKFMKDMSNFIAPEPAIKSMLFGVLQSSRHPYEHITGDNEDAKQESTDGFDPAI